MFYQYFRPFNCICNVFGVSKPRISIEGKSVSTDSFIKVWCLIVAAVFIASYCFSLTMDDIDLKDGLELISDVNNLVANIIIILVNLCNGIKVYIDIHKTFNIIFNDLNFDFIILKLFALKMYFWFSIPTVVFIVLVLLETVSKSQPYDLLIRTPMFLSMMHLFMHLYVKLALLKFINGKLSKTLVHKNEQLYEKESGTKTGKVKYVLNPAIKFAKFNDHVHFDIKLLCKIYDNLSTCVHLLEQIHGLEILISIWLMFTSGVAGMTLIVCNQVSRLLYQYSAVIIVRTTIIDFYQATTAALEGICCWGAKIKWLVFVKSILPFFWGFIGCCIDEQLRTEVNQTVTLIIKCLIDYRCVPTMKPALETFKQLVSNDRLQFTACSLFHLSYAMLLGTILNVITYSIILIQMSLN